MNPWRFGLSRETCSARRSVHSTTKSLQGHVPREVTISFRLTMFTWLRKYCQPRFWSICSVKSMKCHRLKETLQFFVLFHWTDLASQPEPINRLTYHWSIAQSAVCYWAISMYTKITFLQPAFSSSGQRHFASFWLPFVHWDDLSTQSHWKKTNKKCSN